MGRSNGGRRAPVRVTASKGLVLACLAALTTGILVGPEPSRAGSSRAAGSEGAAELAQGNVGIAGKVTIRVVLDRAGRGSFLAGGALSDSGSAKATRSVRRGRAGLTETLEGSSGTLVIRVDQACGKKESAWRVLRGAGSYAGLGGGGRGTGRIPCGPLKPFRGVYRGTVRSSGVQPAAAPGAYGGWTSQNERVTFEVLAGGHSVGNIRIERLHATCDPPLDVTVEPAFLSAYTIAADGRFTATSGDTEISGTFDGASSSGTVTYASSRAGKCTSGEVTWSASSPPPPLPSALPGNYCGPTAQGLGICLSLAPGGRITYVRIEARLECVLSLVDGALAAPEQARFEVVMGYGGGSVPLRSNLSFEVLGSLGGDAGLNVVGDAEGEYVLRGTFGTDGRVSGTLSLHQTAFDDQEGRLYKCTDASFGWQAARTP